MSVLNTVRTRIRAVYIGSGTGWSCAVKKITRARVLNTPSRWTETGPGTEGARSRAETPRPVRGRAVPCARGTCPFPCRHETRGTSATGTRPEPGRREREQQRVTHDVITGLQPYTVLYGRNTYVCRTALVRSAITSDCPETHVPKLPSGSDPFREHFQLWRHPQRTLFFLNFFWGGGGYISYAH